MYTVGAQEVFLTYTVIEILTWCIESSVTLSTYSYNNLCNGFS